MIYLAHGLLPFVDTASPVKTDPRHGAIFIFNSQLRLLDKTGKSSYRTAWAKWRRRIPHKNVHTVDPVVRSTTCAVDAATTQRHGRDTPEERLSVR